ncbi:MAG: hypothetical protein AM326_12035 [Candidatus Thorarchaeota archaeon SMTZ-45]|nr:MAG: hypothetical protein AM325_15655 [Candidatus Thorarchaeota archaeon SMTZ1-45]KXH71100.1 MAG: hypothetical protein AM326_12035 [Candidatus Thorarchaeota archaeon SMTZ-45]
MYAVLGFIVFIVLISVSLPIIFPSILTGCVAFLIALKPEDHEGWLYYGDLLIKQNQYIEALDAYQTAAKLRPDITKIWMKLGNLFNELGQFDEADKAFRTGLGSNFL